MTTTRYPLRMRDDHIDARGRTYQVVEFPSGRYGCYSPDVARWERDHARAMGRDYVHETVQICQWIAGRGGVEGRWDATQARFFTPTLAAMIPGASVLAIDLGAAWMLDVADTAAAIAYASARLSPIYLDTFDDADAEASR